MCCKAYLSFTGIILSSFLFYKLAVLTGSSATPTAVKVLRDFNPARELVHTCTDWLELQVASPNLGLDPGYFSEPAVIEFPTDGPDGEPMARKAYLNFCTPVSMA
eukprot:SAG31_NODE_2744_length_5150_cov_4.544249_6_plen_105_part_00